MKEAWYAHWKQGGEGCDYTIGCGHDFDKLKATTREEAEKEALDRHSKHDPDNVESITLLRVVEVVDMADALAARITALRAQEERAISEGKRRQLAKLKAELGEDEDED